MSGHSHSLEFSTKARGDLRDIRAFSEIRWGKDQAVAYAHGLATATEKIRDNPEIGAIRYLGGRELRVLPVDSHLIVYRLSASRIRVLRVIHKSRDFGRIALDL
jgi:toxin ParE1/3/4